MSMRWALMSRRPSSNTAKSPTGPAPMITASVSMFSVIDVASVPNCGAPCMSGAHRRERDLQAVELRRPQDLAGEPGGFARERHHVELVLLLVGRGVEPVQPRFPDEDVTGGALARAAANALDRQVPVADDLHHPPAFERLEGVAVALMVDDVDDAHSGSCLRDAGAGRGRDCDPNGVFRTRYRVFGAPRQRGGTPPRPRRSGMAAPLPRRATRPVTWSAASSARSRPSGSARARSWSPSAAAARG